jgi:hypothetical protein
MRHALHRGPAVPTRSRSDGLAVFLLALAIAAACVAIWAGDRRAELWGPRVLAVAGNGQVWLVNDAELLIADDTGRLQQRVDLRPLALPGPVNALAPLPAPDGQVRMLVGVIHLPDWLILDEQAREVGRIHPQGIGEDFHETFQLAADEQGRIAMATSGGHRVHLIAADGRHLAESAAGLFRFANGVWPAEGRWRVVDTNHHRILDLAQDSLAQRAAVAVPRVGAAAFPALARENPAGGITVSLLENAMDSGVIIDIDDEGRQLRRYPLPGDDAKPVDFVWLADGLLVAERSSRSLILVDADARNSRTWGDSAFNAALDESRSTRRYWSNLLLAAQIGGALFGLAGLLAYVRSRQAPVAGGGVAAAASSTLATPWLPARDEVLARLPLVWPLLPPVLAVFLIQFIDKSWLDPLVLPWRGTPWMVPIAVTIAVVIIAAFVALALWAGARIVRALHDPANEALLAGPAVRWWLGASAAQAELQPGEQAREVLSVLPVGLFPGLNRQIWVLTDRRVLILAPGIGHEARLLAALPRRDCKGTFTTTTLRMRLLGGRDRIELACRDGRRFAGGPVSPRTAERLAGLLGAARSGSTAWADPATRPARRSPGPFAAFLMSLILPGLAQWLQDRFKLAVVLIAGSALMVVTVVAPVMLGWAGHYYDVAPLGGAMMLLPAAIWSLMAGIDAGAHARRAHRRDR